MEIQSGWENLSPKEKKLRLFESQKKTLDIFLKNGAISPAQYNKSYTDLKVKMGIGDQDLD